MRARELIPVKEYTSEQGRFRTLSETQIDEMQKYDDFFHKQLNDLDGTTIF